MLIELVEESKVSPDARSPAGVEVDRAGRKGALGAKLEAPINATSCLPGRAGPRQGPRCGNRSAPPRTGSAWRMTRAIRKLIDDGDSNSRDYSQPDPKRRGGQVEAGTHATFPGVMTIRCCGYSFAIKGQAFWTPGQRLGKTLVPFIRDRKATAMKRFSSAAMFLSIAAMCALASRGAWAADPHELVTDDAKQKAAMSDHQRLQRGGHHRAVARPRARSSRMEARRIEAAPKAICAASPHHCRTLSRLNTHVIRMDFKSQPLALLAYFGGHQDHRTIEEGRCRQRRHGGC